MAALLGIFIAPNVRRSVFVKRFDIIERQMHASRFPPIRACGEIRSLWADVVVYFAAGLTSSLLIC
jgi:hypothetical protein